MQPKRSTKTVKKAKKIDDNTYQTEEGIETFGRIAKDHPLLADGAQVQELTTQSNVKLEDDHGTGSEIVLRTFEFSLNPIYKNYPPAQEIFNSHINGMQAMLWADGLKPTPEIDPRILFAKNGKGYKIVIACRPLLGQMVVDKPRTLSEIVHMK